VSVAVDGQAVRLTRREFELLRYLVQNKNRVVSRDRLLRACVGLRPAGRDAIRDVHVGRFRGKLGEAGRQIETVVRPRLPVYRLAIRQPFSERVDTSRSNSCRARSTRCHPRSSRDGCTVSSS